MFSSTDIVLEPSSNMLEACRTCLRLIDMDNSPFYEIKAENLKLLTETCRYKLLSIVPELGLDITPKSMLCAKCHGSLEALFEFKEKCLKTENIIAQYLKAKPDLDIRNLDLKDVSAFNAADVKITENETAEVSNQDVGVKEEIEVCDTIISNVKHEVEDFSSESVEVAWPKNAMANSTCKYCDKFCKDSSSLKIHLRTHAGKKLHHCEICNRQFQKKLHLTVHLRTHTGEKPYRCETCHRSFAHKSNLTVHLRIHTGEKSHRCEICDRSFVKKHDLTVHSRTHTGEKPYCCEMCNRTFTHKSNLIAHLRIHTGEWSYVCTLCGKGHSSKFNLKEHMRTHNKEQQQ